MSQGSSPAPNTRLVADIGGTNARFALIEDGRTTGERTLLARDHPGLAEAMRAYLGERRVREAVVAVATPVSGDLVRFTNSPWSFSIEATRQALGLEKLWVINDFVAQALALPRLAESELRRFGGGEPVPGRPKLILGPGTGLGVGALVPVGSRWVPLPSEGGHIAFAPADAREAAILDVLRRRFGRVSIARIGPGILNLAQALAEVRGERLDATTPEEVTRRAAGDGCPICAEAVRLFSRILGAAAGDLALVVLALGGVYVAGDLCRKLGGLFDIGEFRSTFESKGRFQPLLAAVPTYLILREQTGLLGAAAFEPTG